MQKYTQMWSSLSASGPDGHLIPFRSSSMIPQIVTFLLGKAQMLPSTQLNMGN